MQVLKKYNAKLTITFIGSEKELSKDFIKNNFNREYTYYEFDQGNCSPGYNSKFLQMLSNKFRFCYQKSIEKKPNISLLAGSNDFISMNFFEQIINYYDPNKKQLFGIDDYFNGGYYIDDITKMSKTNFSNFGDIIDDIYKKNLINKLGNKCANYIVKNHIFDKHRFEEIIFT
tara:strand:- start:297 stop:815 length:519 start_codon:yes stop_codon:yes gene_type:complete